MPAAAAPRVSILMADDDEDDRELARDAFVDAGVDGEIRFANDGQELIDYLQAHPGMEDAERPSIVLLDLNMPRKDGREVLAELKRDDALCQIPIIVLTTTRDQAEVDSCYRAGASSFIAKPTTHAGLVEVMRHLQRYWFELVKLPQVPDAAGF